MRSFEPYGDLLLGSAALGLSLLRRRLLRLDLHHSLNRWRSGRDRGVRGWGLSADRGGLKRRADDRPFQVVNTATLRKTRTQNFNNKEIDRGLANAHWSLRRLMKGTTKNRSHVNKGFNSDKSDRGPTNVRWRPRSS